MLSCLWEIGISVMRCAVGANDRVEFDEQLGRVFGFEFEEGIGDKRG